MRKLIIAFLIFIVLKNIYCADEVPYKNPILPVHQRVEDLLNRMTLEEKVAQMLCIWQKKKQMLLDKNGNFDFNKAMKHFKQGRGIGQIGRISDAGRGKTAREMAELANQIQKFFIEHSRLGIPVIIHEEALHGLAAKQATSYPQPIGLASTFDPELVEKIFSAIALETRSRGVHQVLTPVVDVAREPRWGRVEETYGEDPYLISRMGMAAVKGLQGDGTFKNKKHVLSTLKHFAAHGQPESGTNCAPANYSERIIREVFLFPFKEIIQEANVASVMASYNEIDGVPSHANRWLLWDVLRKAWGFDGFVVSDYSAIAQLFERSGFGHHVARSKKEAALLASKAGVNIELPEPDCYPYLVELVREGKITENHLDTLVAQMLKYKFKMGLFEDPYVDPDQAERLTNLPDHNKLALQAAFETVVLLKNENNILPLKKDKLNSIAVIGPNADRELLGGYSGEPPYFVTVLDGIKNLVGSKIKVLYSEGCKITTTQGWHNDDVKLNNSASDAKMIQDAVEVAKQADVIILALGGNEQTSREAWNFSHLGDRANLQLVGRQMDLVQEIIKTGKPVIALLFNGRPLAVTELSKMVPALLECWYLGQESGNAVAKVLFGEYNPGGKLPITIPRSVGHVPAYYNYKPSARRGYLFDEISPLYAFGYGLSYTHFKLKNIRLKKSIIAMDESTEVFVDVKNVGTLTGDETVQMYIRDRFSSVTRPVKELKGFKRITLKPGETKTVKFKITPENLAFYDINMNFVVEPGDFDIMIGISSRDEDLIKVTLTIR